MSLLSEIDNERRKLSEYYKVLDDKDKELIQKKANEFDDPESFLEGYKYATEQPSIKSINLISIYAYDYIPRNVHTNIKNATTKIREIFRNKLHNLTF